MLWQLLKATRPKQWIKNGIIFMALVFSANESWRPTEFASARGYVSRALLAFVLFCGVSAAIYLINDLLDLERDRLHPIKRRRPLASGRVAAPVALAAAIALLGTAIPLAVGFKPEFGLTAAGYAVAMVSYSLYWKHLVILDVLVIASGFVLRAIAGALAIEVPISPWLYVCTILAALFLAFGKRRAELTLLSDAGQHRKSLEQYSLPLLDQYLGVVAAASVISYSLYTFTATNLPRNHAMMLTIPFVLYGVFRYLYLIHRHNAGGAPEELLLSDGPLIITIVLWLATALTILVLYRG